MTTRSTDAVFAAVLFVTFVAAGSAEAGTMWSWGGRISSPQTVSVSGTLVIGRVDAPPLPPAADGTPQVRKQVFIPHGLFLQAEPGVGGGKVGLGFLKGLPPVAAGGAQVFFLRTWGAPLWNETGRSYAGLELDATLFVKLSLGVMRRVDSGRRETKVTGGIGFGF
jgi:hypothetical protein